MDLSSTSSSTSSDSSRRPSKGLEIKERSALRWCAFWKSWQASSDEFALNALDSHTKAGFLVKEGEPPTCFSPAPWSERWFVLHDGFLFYFKPAGGSGLVLAKLPSGCISIRNSSITTIAAYKNRPNVLQITSPLPRKPGHPTPGVFHIQAESATVMREWIEELMAHGALSLTSGEATAREAEAAAAAAAVAPSRCQQELENWIAGEMSLSFSGSGRLKKELCQTRAEEGQPSEGASATPSTPGSPPKPALQPSASGELPLSRTSPQLTSPGPKSAPSEASTLTEDLPTVSSVASSAAITTLDEASAPTAILEDSAQESPDPPAQRAAEGDDRVFGGRRHARSDVKCEANPVLEEGPAGEAGECGADQQADQQERWRQFWTGVKVGDRKEFTLQNLLKHVSKSGLLTKAGEGKRGGAGQSQDFGHYKWQQRWFVLDRELLFYFRDAEKTGPLLSSTPNGCIFLPVARLIPRPDRDMPYVFEIEPVTPRNPRRGSREDPTFFLLQAKSLQVQAPPPGRA
ncbi:hypothetical protein CYMTET_26683 [Cymbomonas tetramitiformis]|uniref:PH domain-containing protein n=1 Tax=Cymbomonas tetramitiformis TaxID=36881 RepID=A0AAE0FR92_9CHLO|nr:hypothetical protein CYMTET_26683 [Cymbomonas tetramitiformis]